MIHSFPAQLLQLSRNCHVTVAMALAMTNRHVLGAALMSVTLAAPAAAQDDFQQWLTASARLDLADTIAVQNETVARFSDDRGGLYEIENSTLLGYKFSKKLVVWAGYVHNPQYAAGDFTIMEHRAREQVTVDNFATIGPASLSARLRLEQRWRDGIDGTGWRLRPYVKLGIPLGGTSAPTLNLTTETFINLTTTAFQSTSGLDRARSAIALSFPVSTVVRIEAGYLNQHRFVRNGPDSDDHVLTASLGLAF